MKKKGVIILIILIAAAAAGVFFYMKYTKTGDSPASGTAVAVMPVKDFTAAWSSASNRYSGVVETQKKESVKLDLSKTVKEILVDEGSEVKAGDALFTYDTAGTELEIQQKKLEIERLDASAAGYNEQIAELEKQMSTGKLSEAEKLNCSAQIMEAQTAVAQAEYDKKMKQAEIAKLQAAVEDNAVTAPMAGTVEKIADPKTLSEGSDAFITIVAAGDFRIKGTVSEQNIAMIAEGKEVIIRSRVDETRTWKGVITGLETAPQDTEQDPMMYSWDGDSSNLASKYVFYVEPENVDGLLLGQHVTIEEDPGELPDADSVYVPDGYLVFEEDSTYVWTAAEPGRPLEKRQVQAGEWNEAWYLYEIESGLSADEYIAWPDESCTEGAPTMSQAALNELPADGTGTEDRLVEEIAGAVTDGRTFSAGA